MINYYYFTVIGEIIPIIVNIKYKFLQTNKKIKSCVC